MLATKNAAVTTVTDRLKHFGMIRQACDIRLAIENICAGGFQVCNCMGYV